MTELGQKLFSANEALGGVSQTKIDIVSAGVSNDPAQKCDPSGMPLTVVWNLRGMQFIQAPTKMVQIVSVPEDLAGDLDRRAGAAEERRER